MELTWNWQWEDGAQLQVSHYLTTSAYGAVILALAASVSSSGKYRTDSLKFFLLFLKHILVLSKF